MRSWAGWVLKPEHCNNTPPAASLSRRSRSFPSKYP